MITLYGMYRSRATRNIWALEELGLPYTLKPVIQAYRLEAKGIDPLAPDAPFNTRSPEYLRLTSAGAIPVMEDAGLLLSESLAINLYLAKKAGGTLAPRDAREEALMMQWALYGATAIEGPALEITFAYAKGVDEGGQRVIETSADQLLRPLKALEVHLAAHSHMVGGRFTVADINMAEIVRYAQPHAPLMAQVPRVKSWLELCQSRPAFKKMWATRDGEPA
ncbi:glutathione S-transferase family protein [Sedimentimonas flavescens]|uniref:glutathione S-transferase family protein n=1 Tax=Sedimentimonas flavescens TaxID=2851012 RepID=UPI001C49E253|nr:glutathione S-transferase family protein [Sedimentimonas flavescens]MBW0156599.1 glutathione S-transferase family protein [Sedimentimonas flavescens]MCT2539093.1 glutathione S-transferase family protein [Sedimentimonas flavescens]WBL32365.1 glutathione S-transferase family protein [Sinirhodobacter sp. HNIBRBA609]